ncbi:malate dehydrogenase, mitochondrial-like [Musca vetustissima]|uniref:malate dehydrogenase, mitochondrial-like n=1 Tax=Musca vetustissima TaxID=27455 RepID=UPI002AB6909D|nr:malate dehydrogenase, mitochondrial-like [Musca vetustissima]
MLKNFRRFVSQEVFEFCKISIIGANGGVGRSLAQQLKQNNRFSEICLYDISCTKGLVTDLSHINTIPKVTGYSGAENLHEALRCCDILVLTGGQSHTPSITSREQMFEGNAKLMVHLIETLAKVSGKEGSQPHFHIVTNPVNSLVPLAAELLKKHGIYNPRRLSGCTKVDAMRAATFLAEYMAVDPRYVHVPVIGGHSEKSIVPLLSQSQPKFALDLETQIKLANRIINGGQEVVLAKNHQGAAQHSMGYCVAQFCDSVVSALQGVKNIQEVGFIPSEINELPYFACQFQLNREGIGGHQRLPPMLTFEIELYNRAKDDIRENIERAKEFMEKNKL